MDCLDDNAASEFVSGASNGARLHLIETHLAGCRDCRALVATLAVVGDHDSNVDTRKRERDVGSQAGKRPVRTHSIGDRVGRYLVLSTLGTGGMGVVYAAYDPQLDRKVALKLLRGNLGVTTAEARTRLKREAQAIAQLSHPNVVAVYDVGTTDDDDVYVAMEFVEGDTLTTWLKKWPRTWREILDVYLQAGRGLYAAHSVGLLHRDFKPDNVLVGGDGRVRVTDFGLARSVLGPDQIESRRTPPLGSALHDELTATGTVLGTPRYMPPEQLTGPDIDSRSDQFSFCVALYESLYGTHPLGGATAVAMLETGVRATPPPEAAKVPPMVGRAVLRGLEKERAKRFPTMAALLAELTPAPAGRPARLAMFIALVVVIAGGATGAALIRPQSGDMTTALANEDSTVKDLIDRINRLESQRKELRDELIALKASAGLSAQQVEDLRAQLEQKDGQIVQLEDELTHIKEKQVVDRPVRRPPESGLISTALAQAQHDVEGCFDEWADRVGYDPIADKHTKLPVEGELEINLEVSPEGLGSSPHASGMTDEQLRGCSEQAIARVHYPASPEVRQIEVDVAWAGTNGLVAMSARIVGHRDASSRTIDLR